MSTECSNGVAKKVFAPWPTSCWLVRTNDPWNIAVANVDNMLKLDADYAVFAVFSPYPGTDSFAEGAKMGLYEADCWDRMMKTLSAV